MAHLTTDSPLSRSIVRAFLDFLNSVEPAPGADVEGLEVARECLTEVFKLNTSPTDVHAKSVSLVDIFKSLESSKQCEASQSDVGKQPDDMDASSSFTAHNADHRPTHSEARKSPDEDWTRRSCTFGVSKDELCGQFFNALEKVHFFRTNPDGTDDPVQLEKASHIFNDAVMEMERSECQEFSLKNMAELLKSQGNKAMQSKKYPYAIDLYTCAVALCEENAIYYCNRAAAYTQIHKYTEAIQDCHKSIEIDPNYSKAYSRLGLAYYAQGNYRDAIDKGFRKALPLDPSNESIKENIRVAEQKLIEEQHRADHSQNSRSSEESHNRSTRGSRGNAAPRPFNSMSFNPNDLASMFMNIAADTTNAHQGQHPQERQGEDSNTNSSNEPEIRIGSNINLNFNQMPEDLSGVLRSVMEMLSGAAPPDSGQQEDHFNGRTAPN